jgi:hypothetical protein
MSVIQEPAATCEGPAADLLAALHAPPDQSCTMVGLQPTVVHFSAATKLFDHARMAASPDDSRGPTDEQVGRKLAALREVMGFDIPALATRSRIDADIIVAI